MKIAAGIIGLIIGLLVLLQSCAVATTASLAEIEIGKQEGSVGVFVAFAMFVGGAFAFGLPGSERDLFRCWRPRPPGLDDVRRPGDLGRRCLGVSRNDWLGVLFSAARP